MQIEFVSYDGKYPNLCSGIFKVRIDGELVAFGYDWKLREEDRNLPIFSLFWQSGGSVDWRGEYDKVEREPWQLCYGNADCKILWEFFDLTSMEGDQLLSDLIDCFNENVPYGCCGGCI